MENITNPDYWECECRTGFVRSERTPTCPICQMSHDEQPDAMHDTVSAELANRVRYVTQRLDVSGDEPTEPSEVLAYVNRRRTNLMRMSEGGEVNRYVFATGEAALKVLEMFAPLEDQAA